MDATGTSVKTWFEQSGEPRRVGGNRPFSLTDTESVWMVAEGRVEVFAVPRETKIGYGRRTHVTTIEIGEILLGDGCRTDASALGLIAVGGPETLLLELTVEKFREAATSQDTRQQMLDLVNLWLDRLTFGFTGAIKPTADFILTPTDTVMLNPGQEARARNGVVWVSLASAKPPLLESVAIPAECLTSPFPLTTSCRLKAIEPLQLTPIVAPATTPSLPIFLALWQGLSGYQQVILKGMESHLQMSRAEEAVRLLDRIERDAHKQRHAFEELASVVADQELKLAGIHADKPLLAACQLVGRRHGIDIQEPVESFQGQTLQARVEAIARASRAGVRRATLEDGWWRRDNGPILGFLKASQRPVALLPEKPGSYVLLDPQTRRDLPVDEQIAGGLMPRAYLFYATFPDQQLAIHDLLKPAVRGIRREILMVLLMGSAGAILGLIVPILTGILFDYVVPEASRGKLGQVTLILLTCTVVAAFFEFTKSISILRLKGKIDPVIEAAVLDRVISLPIPFFRRFSTGDLTNRSLGICAISKILSDVSIQTLLGVVFSSFNFILLFWYDWHLALIAVGFTVVGVCAISLTSYFQMRYQRRLSEIEGTLSGILLQMVNGISKLRVSGTENRAFSFWAERFSGKRRIEYKSRALQNMLDTFNGSFPILTAMAIFSWVVLKSSETFTTGNFIAFNAAYTNFQAALLQMGSAFTSLLAIAPYYERARPIFETLPEVRAESSHPGRLNGAISVHQVHFRYDPNGPTILDSVSLQIEPGQFVALVGSSGSGKSTLMRLLLGFEQPESGTIYYDRQDLASLNVQEVRRQIGVVLQNGGIVAGSIFQNIVGTTGMSVDAAWEAAAMVGLKEDIEAIPQGMHTILDPGGFTLSGGQRQRLLIARAIVRKPRMLFFDEATSALDNRTQTLVSQSLERLQASRLVIAHRLSTIRHADKIVVMHKGRIVEHGTYDELMTQEGLFSELAKRQIA